MNPIYSYYYQQQFHHQYGSVTQTHSSMQFPLYARHLTPQQWGAALRDHQYYHHRLRLHLISRGHNPFQNWTASGLSHWHWQRFQTQQAINMVAASRRQQNPWNQMDQQGVSFGPPHWQAMFNNHGVTPPGEHQGNLNEPDNNNHQETVVDVLSNPDVKMIDIAECDDADASTSKENGNFYVEMPDSDGSGGSDVSDNDTDGSAEKDVSVVDSNSSDRNVKDANSLWIDNFLDSCQKNYDNLVECSKDWEAIKGKLEKLEILSKEIDQNQLKVSLKNRF